MTAATAFGVRLPHHQDINHPGGIVRLDQDHIGRIVCRKLEIAAGVRAHVVVNAEEIDVKGHVDGKLYAGRITIFESASADGLCRGRLVQVAGRISGMIHARRTVLRDSARVAGAVVSDDLLRQDGSVLDGYVAVGSGKSEDKDSLRRAEGIVFPSRRESSALRVVQAAEEPVVHQSDDKEEPLSFPESSESDLSEEVAEQAIPYLIR